jgi:hypothetical protein
MLIPIVPTFVRNFVPAYTADLVTKTGVISTTRTIVQKIFPAALSATGSSIKIIAEASPDGPVTLSAAYIGLAATATGAKAWDFASTPVQITWDNGQATKTIEAGQQVESDAASFTIDGSATICIALNMAANSRIIYRTGLGSSSILYFKNSVSEAGTVSKGASYTGTSGRADIISMIMAA